MIDTSHFHYLGGMCPACRNPTYFALGQIQGSWVAVETRAGVFYASAVQGGQPFACIPCLCRPMWEAALSATEAIEKGLINSAQKCDFIP